MQINIFIYKYLSPEGKVRIYKTFVRPVITYGAESRADTTLTKQLLRTTEMRIIRTIHGKTIRDKIRSEDLREQSKIQDSRLGGRSKKVLGRSCWEDACQSFAENRSRQPSTRNKKQRKAKKKMTSIFCHRLIYKLAEQAQAPIKKKKKKKY